MDNGRVRILKGKHQDLFVFVLHKDHTLRYADKFQFSLAIYDSELNLNCRYKKEFASYHPELDSDEDGFTMPRPVKGTEKAYNSFAGKWATFLNDMAKSIEWKNAKECKIKI